MLRKVKTGLALFFSIAVSLSVVFGQQPNPQSTPGQEVGDVIKIKTELVQTDVMVFNRDGKFVDGLKREQFEIRVNGVSRPISFFDRVVAGTGKEETQLAAARGTAPTATETNPSPVRPLDRGRVVFFFIDDLHLSAESYLRTRRMLGKFVDDEMGQNDLVGIASTSGTAGFLQQLTDNKAMLRQAISRLAFRNATNRDFERPVMEEYHAIQIERNDMDAVGFFTDATLKDNPGMDRRTAEIIVRRRAATLVQIGASASTRTLASLRDFIRTYAQFGGRKLIFFISDGFLIESQQTDLFDRVRRTTLEAARAGVVIYTLDARGLATGLPDAASDLPVDPTGRLQRASSSNILATQDPLNALAADTGGRAIRNTNAFDNSIKSAVNEASIYYLLAWQPTEEDEFQRRGARIEVAVIGRPELKVRLRRGFLNQDVDAGPRQLVATREKEKEDPKKPVQSVADREILKAIVAPYPTSALPTSLTLGYFNSLEAGTVLNTSVQVPGSEIFFEVVNGKKIGVVDIAGVVLDTNGRSVKSFKNRLNVSAASLESDQKQWKGVIYVFNTPLPPGLYQVRAVSRDDKTGRTGSAMEWIEVPDLSKPKLAMSTVFVGERRADEGSNDPNQFETIPASVDRRFARTSKLRLLTFIYHAAPTTSANSTPDVVIQLQILRDDQPVLTNALRRVSSEGIKDVTRLPYAAEIALDSFPPGRYVLLATAIDRIAKSSASQRTPFHID